MSFAGGHRGPPLLPTRSPPPWGDQVAALEACAARWRAYERTEVDMAVSPLDDMRSDAPEGLAHYRGTGHSALRLLTDAMVLTGNAAPRRILDLPCGGGRVTRHLVKFFPDSEIVVCDLDRAKVAAVTAQFGVRSIAGSADFTEPLPGRYDLIFVGSLVTHFPAAMFARAVHVLVDALAPGGVLVLTTVGRNWAAAARAQHLAVGRPRHRWWSPALHWATGGRLRSSRGLAAIDGPYARTGFGYVEAKGYTRLYGQSYGGSFSSPAWLMRLVEPRRDAMVIGFKERGFADLQDVLFVQRLPDDPAR